MKAGFNQRRKTLRNSLKTIIDEKAGEEGWTPEEYTSFISDPVFGLRPERLGVEDFISLTGKFSDSGKFLLNL